MASRNPPRSDPRIEEFKRMVEECEIAAVCGRRFIRVEKLKRWLQTHAEGLLEAAYPRRSQPAPPISSTQICRDDNCSLLVFSILLEIGRGNLIKHFHMHRLVDSKLPMDVDGLKTEFERFEIPDAALLATQFDQSQWRFFPAKFHLEDRANYHSPHQIIPISKQNIISEKGGTAKVWQIEIVEDFVGESLRGVASTSKLSGPHHKLGERYHFALKTFEDGNRGLYNNEIEAFQALQGHEGIIRYLCDYGYKEYPSGKTTFNIVLEYGELDLDMYFFEDHLPPVLPTELYTFWKDLFEVPEAVKKIHLFKRKTGDLTQEYYGWHADIKPENILRVKGKFKLADPGFAKFEKKEAFERFENQEQTTIIDGLTITYGAPECHVGRRNRGPVPRAIDIWSLGCVFSVAATWVVLGAQGIVQFENVRKKAIAKLSKKKSSKSSEEHGGDYFHDGYGVLEDVTNWHHLLRNTCRRTDTITPSLLDLVDKKMLCGNPNHRVDATKLCEALEAILGDSAQRRQTLPDSIREALLQVDDEAPSQIGRPKQPTIAVPSLDPDALEDRKTRKSRLLDITLRKTAHRSEALRSEASSITDATKTPESLKKIQEEKIPMLNMEGSSGLAIQKHAKTRPSSQSFVAKSESQDPSPFQSQSPQTYQQNLPRPATSTYSVTSHALKSTASKLKHKTQDVWQARFEMDRQRKGLLKRPKKDGMLTQHFERDRDMHFLVDNSETMAQFWDQAIYLLETLVMKAKGQDEDGMDLTFANGPVKLDKSSNDPAKFRQKMEHKDARPREGNGIHTDMRKPLGKIMYSYKRHVQETTRSGSGKRLRNLTVIVFTDGKWEGMMDQKNDLGSTIVNFVKELKELQHSDLMLRQVTFQFVRFGNDPDAAYRLQQLDDELPFRGVP